MPTHIYSIIIALIFNLIDVITGLIYALKSKTVCSSKLRNGLFKKVGFIGCYVLAFIVDNFGHFVGFELSFDVLPIIILYVVTTELVSIVENISLINPNIVPEQILAWFNITSTGQINTNETEKEDNTED